MLHILLVELSSSITKVISRLETDRNYGAGDAMLLQDGKYDNSLLSRGTRAS
jgi:hypothetical protein